VDASTCSGCGVCEKTCPTGAVEIVDGIAIIEHSLCNDCGSCFYTCPKGAIYQDEASPAVTHSPPSVAIKSPVAVRTGAERRWPVVLSTIAPVALDLALEIVRIIPSRRTGKAAFKPSVGRKESVSSAPGSGYRYRRRGGRG
jgi:Fe-S-cluster-containing hydrogenase component 2